MTKILTNTKLFNEAVEKYQTWLRRIGSMKVHLRVDSSHIEEQYNRAALLSHSIGKLMGWVSQMRDRLSIEFEAWEAEKRISIKRKLEIEKGFHDQSFKARAVDVVKEAEVKDTLKADPMWLKLKLRVGRFKKYSIVVEHGMLWEAARLPKTLDRLKICASSVEGTQGRYKED